MTRSHVAAALACSLALANGLSVAAAARSSFTYQQAYAGRLAYYTSCAECHGGEMQGQFAPALAGPDSRTQYESVQYVYGYYSVHMPHGHPGQLTQEQYVDIMAYMLQQHHWTAGGQPLTAKAINRDATKIGP